ncbi:non-canonical purine NTP pyrophosphatase [Termitidicoccus mucosus]|uniref:dITP/XTP pyrophosphatase n=1 Tax=Termitidicoccus mucosus TaxID=1184151 RepID=A0A178IBM7_9BACT|nr:non-canonical purine NTP pyrophosphatase [Opitutaceae bacterium TSB47]
MKLFLASGNTHKAQEFQSLADASGLPLEILSAKTIGGMPQVEEDTGTFTGNARKKARALREKIDAAAGIPHSAFRIPHSTGAWVMADDSGLCVDALGGDPGVESAYYAGPQGDGAANLAKLVAATRDVPDGARGAHFVCVLLLIAPDGAEHAFEGRCHGRLAREPRGAGGFGYDPVFIPDGHHQTLSELGDAVKNRLSHRGRAWAKAAEFLATRCAS